MILETDRLTLRPWRETDKFSLYEYAKDPDVGPSAGWPIHESVEDSLNVIRNIFNGKECYAICEKGTDKAIGAIELLLNGHTELTNRGDECELGFWIGKPFWGREYMPEAGRELIRHGFEDLGMRAIWCAHFEENNKSARVQKKLGFTFHHKVENIEVSFLNEKKTSIKNLLTKENWKGINDNIIKNM